MLNKTYLLLVDEASVNQNKAVVIAGQYRLRNKSTLINTRKMNLFATQVFCLQTSQFCKILFYKPVECEVDKHLSGDLRG